MNNEQSDHSSQWEDDKSLEQKELSLSPTPKKAPQVEQNMIDPEQRFDENQSEDGSEVHYLSASVSRKSAVPNEADLQPVQLDKTPETARQSRKINQYNIQTSQPPQRLQFPQGASLTSDKKKPTLAESSQQELEFGEQFRISTESLTSGREFRTPRSSRKDSAQPPEIKEFLFPAKNKPQFVEKALPLVTVSKDTGKLVFNEEVNGLLAAVKGPIGVVAVAGMYRTGKSYLLNRVLLNRARGFGVGPSINPCTKGVWIWGTPLQGFTPSGEPISVLVVDTEGLGGLEVDNNHDMRIFTLALLMSSFFVYNSMGQIDETAISSLSLVVNLTKHIQTNSKAGDHADLEQYLPSFLWVLRDFSLQLCDESDKEISAQEYLELTLRQGNNSMDDPKAVIRNCIKKFFSKRDCQTLVRPLVEEEKLQQLGDLDMDQLRPEFVEQVVALRRKVLNKMPAKRIQGQNLDGLSWINLLKVYVQAMNQGSVPNIESSWRYICKQRAEAALKQAIESFEESISELQIPQSLVDLDRSLEEARRGARASFESFAGGDQEIINEVQEQFCKSLNSRIKAISAENLLACQEFAQQMLQQLFHELETFKQQNMQDSQGFANCFSQVEFALRELTIFYDSNCFDFPQKAAFLADGKVHFLTDLLGLQCRNTANQNRLQTDLEQAMKDRLNHQVREAREEARSESMRLEGQWKAVQLAKSELQANNQILSEQLEHLKETNRKDHSEQQSTIATLREDLVRVTEEYRAVKEAHEEQAKDVHRTLKQKTSEYDKEKALLAQKIEFLEKTIQERNSREKDTTSELRNQKAEMSQELKAVMAKYEQQIKALTSALEEERDKAADFETQLNEKVASLQESERKTAEVDATLKEQLYSAQLALQESRDISAQLKQESGQQLLAKLQLRDSEILAQTGIIEDLERSVKESREAYLQVSHESKKDLAMKEQKLEFLEMQLKEAKEQVEEAQKQHEQMIKAINRSGEDEENESSSKKSVARMELMQREFQAVQEKNSATIRGLNLKVEELLHQIDELELQSKLQQSEIQRYLDEQKISAGESNSTKSHLVDRIKQLEQARNQAVEELETRTLALQQSLDRELQEKDEQCHAELFEAQTRSEEQLQQLKNFYDIEKEKVELRIAEEKERTQRRLQAQHEELEARFREDSRDKDAEIELLQAQIHDIEKHQQSYAQQLEHEMGLKLQYIEQLEKQIGELKLKISSSECTRNESYEKYLEHFEQQRLDLNAKIDKLMHENLDKDKTIATLSHQMERANDTMDRKLATLEQSKASLEREKKQVGERFEQTKLRLSEMQDEAMQIKLEYGREQALLTQKIEFLNRKIDDQQQSHEDLQRNFDEKLKHSKLEILEDAQAQVERITSEKELWESKYEQKRKTLKEIEGSLGKKNQELQKQVSLLQVQTDRSVQEKTALADSLQAKIGDLERKLSCSDNMRASSSGAPSQEVVRLKSELNERECELQDLQSNYDRDKALWEGRAKFLKDQKEQYKKDLMDSQRKFEITLEQLQKRGSNDKEKSESNQQAILKVIENKYKTQIKEMLDTQQALNHEQQTKIRRIEKELNETSSNLQGANRGRHDEVFQLEKKLQDCQQREAFLANEVQEIKNDRAKRVEEAKKQLEKDKETFKTRFAESERKAKEAEQRRSQLVFQFEKERANWVLEEDDLRRKQAESEEYIQSLERVKDQLLKENDRFKQELKGSSAQFNRKTFGMGSSTSSSNLAATTAGRFSLTKSGQLSSLNNQNGQGVAGSQANPSIMNAAMTRLKENSTTPYSTQPKNLRQSTSSSSLNPTKMRLEDQFQSVTSSQALRTSLSGMRSSTGVSPNKMPLHASQMPNTSGDKPGLPRSHQPKLSTPQQFSDE